jgi:hypothetical protein
MKPADVKTSIDICVEGGDPIGVSTPNLNNRA